MQNNYEVVHRVYDGFGFVGIDRQQVQASSKLDAIKIAQRAIAGQFDTQRVAVEELV